MAEILSHKLATTLATDIVAHRVDQLSCGICRPVATSPELTLDAHIGSIDCLLEISIHSGIACTQFGPVLSA